MKKSLTWSARKQVSGPRPARRHTLRVLAVVAALSMLAAACGGEETPDGAGGEEVDLAAFCEGVIQGEARFNEGPEVDEQGNPTEGSLQQLRDDMAPLITEIEENTPEDIQSEIETVLNGVRDGLETGDPEAFQNPEFLEADIAVDEYVFENCEFETRQEFVAVDYEYEDIPETMDSGRVAFRMDNEGSEVHEAVVFRVNDDVDASVEDLLDLPQEESEEMVEFRGVMFAGPGDSGYGVVDLEPGRYGFICFIPVGTTSLEDLMDEGGEEGNASPTAGASPTSAASPTGSPTTTASPTGSPAGDDEEGESGEAAAHHTRGMFAEVTVS